jgi:hypothetical protein
MKHILTLLILTTLTLTSCVSSLAFLKAKEGDSASVTTLKQVSSSVLEAVEIEAAEQSLSAARTKLAELRAAPQPADASFASMLGRSLALASAQSLVTMAQTRLDTIKRQKQQEALALTSGK